jgi:hypothetical protein
LLHFVGLGDGFGFGGAERIAILMQKHFEKIAHRPEFGGRQETNESLSLLAFLLDRMTWFAFSSI